MTAGLISNEHANAQTTPAERPTTPQSTSEATEVIVTAEKVSQSVNKVGESINAISGAQLAQTGVNAPADLGKLVPGFNYTQSGYGQPVFTLRGIGSYDKNFQIPPAVSVYLDENPLPFSAMSKGTMLDLDQVEVLKGPQGTLFGENSTGGAINFIAAKPTKTFAAGADLTYSNFGEAIGEAFVSGPITDTLRGRIAFSADEGGAWQQSFTRPGDELGSKRLIDGRILLDWTPTNALSFELNLNGFVDRSDTQAGQFVDLLDPGSVPTALVNTTKALPATPPNARFADWDPNTKYQLNDDFFQAALRSQYHFDNGTTLTSITAYERLDLHSLVDTDGTNVQNFDALTGGNDTSISEELRLDGRALGDRLSWLVGANYEHDAESDFGDPLTAVSSFPFSGASAVAQTTVDTYGVFGHFSYTINDTLSAEAGIRYTDVDTRNQTCTFDGGDGALSAVADELALALGGNHVNIPAGGCVTLNSKTFLPGIVHGTLNEDNVPWKVGLNWQANRTTLLYANVSVGYKAGDFSPAGELFSALDAPAKQERVVAYEAGFKLTLLERTVQLNGAAFYYDYDDKQVQGKMEAPVLGSLNDFINIPRSRVDGGELELSWVPVKDLHLTLGGSYTDSAIQGSFINSNVLGATVNLGGEALPLTPKWQFSGDGQYDVPLTDDLKSFFGVNVSYQSESNSALGNVALFDIPGYTNVDLRAGLSSVANRWTASVFVRNVTDTYSWNFVNLEGPDTVSRLANMPRSYGVRLSYRY
jgi:iron complex outermembrane recepter protein